MTVDPELTVTTVLGWAREISIICGILVVGWKSRDIFQEVLDFKNSILAFMTDMRAFAMRMEHNHLSHVEHYLKRMANLPPDEQMVLDLNDAPLSSESEDARTI